MKRIIVAAGLAVSLVIGMTGCAKKTKQGAVPIIIQNRLLFQFSQYSRNSSHLPIIRFTNG